MTADKITRRLARTNAAHMMDLARLAALKRDRKMRDVVRLAEARSATLRRLGQLSPAAPLAPEAPELWRVTLHHNQWTDELRRNLNSCLARQTGEWLQARDNAARAFGQAEVIQRLARHRSPGAH